MSFKTEKKEIIYWAKLLNERGFVTARSGNISSKVEEDKILITSHDCYLGHLEEGEIILLNSEGKVLQGEREPTSEKELHITIHRHYKDIKCIVHAHSSFTTAYFHYFDTLDIFSFEVKFYLGSIKVVPQETPTVTDVAGVVTALEDSNIVVLQDHGVVAMGSSFKEAFSLIELLEEQAKVNLLLRQPYAQPPLKTPSASAKESVQEKSKQRCRLLSREHIEKLTEVINNDTAVQELGNKYDLTCSLAVKNQDTQEVVCFHYQKGKIVDTDNSDNAEFLITGREQILKKIFNRDIDPFVASTQGKVKTKGDFSKMSKWYPALVRTFQLWEEVPVE